MDLVYYELLDNANKNLRVPPFFFVNKKKYIENKRKE